MTQNDMPTPSQTGSNAIASRLREAILQGKYPYQTKLPPERELADFFSASRGTVRSALHQLEDMGLLARRVGSGTFVTYKPKEEQPNEELDPTGDIVESISPLELIEARLAIEPHMVQLAVLNATARDLDRMRGIVERLETCESDSERFSREDEAFHLCLASASHNRLIVWLYNRLNDVRSHAQWSGVKRSVLKKQNINTYNREHRALYEALLNRDMASARAVISQHLEHARQDLLRVSSD